MRRSRGLLQLPILTIDGTEAKVLSILLQLLYATEYIAIGLPRLPQQQLAGKYVSKYAWRLEVANISDVGGIERVVGTWKKALVQERASGGMKKNVISKVLLLYENRCPAPRG